MQLTDEELVAICEAELDHATSESDLADDRTKAMDYYLGDMSSHVAAQKERSSVVTRDVLDTVESVLPSLMRVFVEADNAVEFLPESQQDEELASLETDAVRTIFYEHNDGFLNLYSFIKDALISKTGIIKAWWEEPQWEREEYSDLNEMELEKLLLDESCRYEILESEQTEDGWDITLKVQRKKGHVEIDVVTPEEFGVSRDACSPDPKAAKFVYHRVQKTVSDLIEEGYDRKIVEDLPTDGDVEDEERLARRHLSDEQNTTGNQNKSMRTVWVTECYIHIDRDDDGIAELLKVTMASVGSGSKLLDVEEVDRIPFVAVTPVILTHKFYGFSLADLVEDIQEIRTVLMRGILDNMYLANNVRMGVNDRVNLDDLLTSRPGGVIRTKGSDNPANHMMPVVHPGVPPESFGLLEVLDNMMKNRTGIGDEVMGLDSEALSNVNTGVIAQAYDAARMRIELMARIIAEIGLKPLFQDIHELLHKNQDESIQLKIRNQWMDIDPKHWKEGRRAKVSVGLGHHSRERKLMAINDVMMLQEKALSLGYNYVQPHQIHAALKDRIDAHGLDVDKYFSDPKTYQPPQKGPDPKVQLEQAKMMLEKEKVQVEREKAQVDGQVKVAIAQAKEREMALRSEIDRLKGQMDIQKMAINEQSQVMKAQTDADRARLDAVISAREQKWTEYKERTQMELDKYKADLAAVVSLREKVMDIEQKVSSEALRHADKLDDTEQRT